MKESITNFAAGIRAASGYTPYKDVAASSIVNYDVDDYGRLVKRRGIKRMNSSPLAATPKSMKRMYYRKAGGLGAREHLVVAINNAQGIWYWNGSAFVELKNSSDSPASSINLTGGRDARLGYEVYGSRGFMGAGSAHRSFWVDISGTTPVVYYHGLGKPSTPTAAVQDGGLALEQDKWYGYVVTCYRHGEEIESEPSSRVVIQTESGPPIKAKVNLTNIPVSADEQVTKRKVYRTTAQDTEAAAEVAQLYLLKTIDDNTTTVYLDDFTDILSDTLLPSADWHSPRTLIAQWHYILGDEGQLWLCDDDDSNVIFSTFDSMGAPVLDGFPTGNVVRANPDDGDIITAIAEASSRINQRLILKRNACYLLYGNTIQTIEVARSRSMGCASPWSVASISLKESEGIFFFGTDKQVWMAIGGSIFPVSLDVNPILEEIPAGRFRQVMGCSYFNKYLLVFPSGDNENDRVLVYDGNTKYWTMYDLAMNWLSWWNGDESQDVDKNRLMGAESGANYIDYLFTDENGNDITDDNGGDITASYTTNIFYMPQESVLTGIYIYDLTGSTYSVRVDSVTQDGVGTGTTHTGFSPSANNNYRQGIFERGRGFQIHFETTSPRSLVERLEIEWEKT